MTRVAFVPTDAEKPQLDEPGAVVRESIVSVGPEEAGKARQDALGDQEADGYWRRRRMY